MPIYEYECNACGHKLEAFQKMSEAPLTQCPKCNASSLHKLISAAGFQLKGTGWYATDFRNKGKPETDKTNSQETTKDDKSSSASSSESTSTSNKEVKTSSSSSSGGDTT